MNEIKLRLGIIYMTMDSDNTRINKQIFISLANHSIQKQLLEIAKINEIVTRGRGDLKSRRSTKHIDRLET